MYFVFSLFRGKTISLEKIRMRLLHDLESYEGEDKCLAEYRKELELLQQEKMAHVEELRQIHSDINAVSKQPFVDVENFLNDNMLE